MEAHTHQKIHQILQNARKPIFVSDERVDGDSLGASLAMAHYCARTHATDVPIYVAQLVPEKYMILPGIERCTDDVTIFDDADVDVVVTFDCSDAAFVERLVDRVPGTPKVINIDHHNTNTHYGDVNQVLSEAPAAAEVVYRWYKENNVPVAKEAATCLLLGICFDTTIFSNNGTNRRAFEAASDLLRRGARIRDVIRIMYQNRSVDALRLWGVALERLQEHEAMNCVTTCLTRDDIDRNGATDEDAAGLSDFLNLVIDADTLLILRETTDGAVKASMRSKTRDVGALAKAFGGGGHTGAAGFTIPESRLACNDDGQWRVEKAA